MLVLIGVQENDDQYHSPWEDALAVSKDHRKLEQLRDKFLREGDHSYSEFRIKEILDLDGGDGP